MRRFSAMPSKIHKLAVLTSAVSLTAAALLGGCNAKGFLDPSELGRGGKRRGDALTVKIIDQLDPGAEEVDPQFRGAEDVRPQDLVSVPTDYTVGPGDVVDVAVTDLHGTGMESVNTRQVTESGNINLPLLKSPVRAQGLTETELAQAVTQAYRDQNVITDAQVSVTLRLKRARTYSIRGAIEQPGEYEITTNDFRLLNALVQARDISRGSGNAVDTIYVIRKLESERPPREGAGAPATTTTPATPPGSRDPLAPRSSRDAQPQSLKPVALMQVAAPSNPTRSNQTRSNQTKPPANETPTAANTAATVPAGDVQGRYIIVDGKAVPVGAQGTAVNAAARAQPQTRGSGTGTAAPAPRPGVGATGAGTTGAAAPRPGAQQGAQRPGAAPAGTGARQKTAPGSFTFNAPEAEGETRTIRIPYDALRNGEMQYNIVIRPQDMIIVPEPRTAVYYMGGHVGAPGAYTMVPGNKVTLMDAVISARMLDGVAIPARTDIVRRRGDEKMWVRVDLDKIFSGQQPDIYLKENDNVLVGTNAVAPFLAAFRNAFRVTYGFGFIYDRNFAYDRDDNDNNNDPIP